MLEKMWRKGNSLTLLLEMKIDAATMETVLRFIRKLKIELPYDPEILLLENTIHFYPDKTIIQETRTLSNTIHKNKLKMD